VIPADRKLHVVARPVVEVDAHVRAIVPTVVPQHPILTLMRQGGEKIRLLTVLSIEIEFVLVFPDERAT
jgi:hypothetical protein